MENQTYLDEIHVKVSNEKVLRLSLEKSIAVLQDRLDELIDKDTKRIALQDIAVSRALATQQQQHDVERTHMVQCHEEALKKSIQDATQSIQLAEAQRQVSVFQITE